MNIILKYGHWPSQIIPPMCLFLMFFNNHGPALWFLLLLPIFISIYSFFSLISKLFTLRTKLRFIARPTLTIINTAALVFLANYSFSSAEAETLVLAQAIQQECIANKECPTDIHSFNDASYHSFKHSVGSMFIKYPLFYNSTTESFNLYLGQSLDMGISYKGGIKVSLQVGR